MAGDEKAEIKVLKCIGNEIRYKILQLLRERERCVSEIMEELDKEQTLISHHLQSLHECNLVEKEKDGRKMIYRIRDPSILDFMKQVENLSKRFCKNAPADVSKN